MRLLLVGRVVVFLAAATLAGLAAQRAVASRRSERPDTARARAAAPVVMQRFPARVGQGGDLADDAARVGRGGPWYVICARHQSGYCSDPYFDFDTAMVRAESHRRRFNHVGVGVSTACPF